MKTTPYKSTTNEAAFYYCPYVPLSVANSINSVPVISPFISIRTRYDIIAPVEQIDDFTFRLNGEDGNNIAVWILENIPKEFRKVSHYDDHLIAEINNDEYIILFKLRWL